MKFPMRDEMTVEQVASHKVAQLDLVRGKYYRFDPSVTAVAIPTGGPKTCTLEECEFDRGWYIGLIDGYHVFQSKPINDQRTISVPEGYENSLSLAVIIEQLRDSYFLAQFTADGSAAILDVDQKSH